MASQKIVESRRSRRDTGDVKAASTRQSPRRTRKAAKKPKAPPPQIIAELHKPLATFVF
jgi:hypothetical protein